MEGGTPERHCITIAMTSRRAIADLREPKARPTVGQPDALKMYAIRRGTRASTVGEQRQK